MRYWGLLPAFFLFYGCVFIPLPDGGPELQKVSPPTLGLSTGEVQEIFGKPELLDTPHFKIYEWSAGRRFVIVPTIPTGIPVGGIFAKDRTRLLVAFDEQGKVMRSECSVTSLSLEQLQAIGCLDPKKSNSPANPLEVRKLNDLQELRKVSFYDGRMGGSYLKLVLSPDGQLLAGVDTDLHVWVVDLEKLRVIYDFQAAKPGWVTGGMARVAFSSDSQMLVISQPDNPILVLNRLADRFVENIQLDSLGGDNIHFAEQDNSTLIGLGKDQALQISAQGSLISRSGREGHIFFGPDGPVLKKPVNPEPLLTAILDLSWHKPSQRAVFSASGQGMAVLDPRNDFARQYGSGNFLFSPGGDWLASNNCQYLALWNSRKLSGMLVGTGPDRGISPDLATLIPLAPGDNNSADECLGPLAFSPSGDQVAVAGRYAIHVWSLFPGSPPKMSAPLSFNITKYVPPPRYRILDIVLTADRQLVAVMAYYSELSILRWQLPQVE